MSSPLESARFKSLARMGTSSKLSIKLRSLRNGVRNAKILREISGKTIIGRKIIRDNKNLRGCKERCLREQELTALPLRLKKNLTRNMNITKALRKKKQIKQRNLGSQINKKQTDSLHISKQMKMITMSHLALSLQMK